MNLAKAEGHFFPLSRKGKNTLTLLVFRKRVNFYRLKPKVNGGDISDCKITMFISPYRLSIFVLSIFFLFFILPLS